MRAIRIDPYTETISEVVFSGPYTQIYDLLSDPEHRVSTFEVVNLGKGETLYVDEEGLLHNPTHFFQWHGYHQPLAGRGLILGTTRGGNEAATKLSLDEVRAKVTWANSLAFEGFNPIPPGTVTDHPLLGPNTPVIGRRPVFTKK